MKSLLQVRMNIVIINIALVALFNDVFDFAEVQNVRRSALTI